MKTKISSNGQIVLLAEIRQRDGITPGEQFTVERLDAGQYLLRREQQPNNAGVVDWLRACPSDNWFRSLPSESADDL